MDIMTSSESRIRLFKFFRWLALISVAQKVMKSNYKNTLLLLFLIGVLVVNDELRDRLKKKKKVLFKHISFIISLIVIGYILYCIRPLSQMGYYYLASVEVITLSDTSIFLCVMIVIAYFITSSWTLGISLVCLRETLVSLFLNFLLALLIKGVVIEKIKTDTINAQLKEANEKLKEYSRTIEELTVTKERTRIAQELHDSIGHSLVAINMNLEFAESAVDINPEKAKEVINKAYGISKNCMKDLRKAVSLLKDKFETQTLRDSLNDIFQNFKSSNTVRFILNMDEEVEKSDIEVKDCIFKTVREAVTNGIKHGKAHNFQVQLRKEEKNILLNIINDGEACDDIVKSNGVLGIEERVKRLNGAARFFSEGQRGFNIEIVIPDSNRGH